jgi:hypothetical protein
MISTNHLVLLGEMMVVEWQYGIIIRERQETHTEFYWGNLLESGHFDRQDNIKNNFREICYEDEGQNKLQDHVQWQSGNSSNEPLDSATRQFISFGACTIWVTREEVVPEPSWLSR